MRQMPQCQLHAGHNSHHYDRATCIDHAARQQVGSCTPQCHTAHQCPSRIARKTEVQGSWLPARAPLRHERCCCCLLHQNNSPNTMLRNLCFFMYVFKTAAGAASLHARRMATIAYCRAWSPMPAAQCCAVVIAGITCHVCTTN